MLTIAKTPKLAVYYYIMLLKTLNAHTGIAISSCKYFPCFTVISHYYINVY